MKRFVIGDIHGAHKALLQCFERSGFQTETDMLITLGDVCDCWPQVRECVDTLLSVPNRVSLLGNHDQWALEWMHGGSKEQLWISQGGRSTISSYQEDYMKVPSSHYNFLRDCRFFWEQDNLLFVHAGIDFTKSGLHEQDPETCLWDRKMVYSCQKDAEENPDIKFGSWKRIYVGHTPTQNFRSETPLSFGNVTLLDTGAGHSGCLTMMDMDTGEYFQSDNVPLLYPNHAPRGF